MQSGQRIDREMAAFVPDKYDSYGRGTRETGKGKGFPEERLCSGELC